MTDLPFPKSLPDFQRLQQIRRRIHTPTCTPRETTFVKVHEPDKHGQLNLEVEEVGR